MQEPSSPTSPPRWEKLEAPDAARISSLVRAASRLGVESARTRLDALVQGTLEWTLARVDRAVASQETLGKGPLAAIALSLPEGPALVVVDPWLVHVAVDRVLGGEGALALDASPLAEIEAGVFVFIVSSMLVGTGVQIASAHRHGAACAAWLNEARCDRWHWRVRAGEHHAFVTLWVSDQVTARSLASEASLPVRPLPSVLQLRIGEAMLSRAEVVQLAVGDVLIPDALSIATQDGALTGQVDWCTPLGEVFVHTKRTHAADSWRVHAPPDNVLRAHRAQLETPMSADERTLELPLTLTLTLGQVTLTHAEAQAMLPGTVVKTGIPSGGQVHLMAGDTVVARGEIVEIQGELGVRVLRVYE